MIEGQMCVSSMDDDLVEDNLVEDTVGKDTLVEDSSPFLRRSSLTGLRKASLRQATKPHTSITFPIPIPLSRVDVRIVFHKIALVRRYPALKRDCNCRIPYTTV